MNESEREGERERQNKQIQTRSWKEAKRGTSLVANIGGEVALTAAK